MGRGAYTTDTGELLERYQTGYRAGEKGRAHRLRALAARKAVRA